MKIAGHPAYPGLCKPGFAVSDMLSQDRRDRFSRLRGRVRKVIEPVFCEPRGGPVCDVEPVDGPISPYFVWPDSSPASRTHIYRNETRIAVLREHGIDARGLVFDPATPEKLDRADIVIVVREMWGEWFSHLRSACFKSHTPLVYDVDDLVFDPNVIKARNFEFFDTWQKRHSAARYRRALISCDALTVPCGSLAEAGRWLGVPAWIFPNGMSSVSLEKSRAISERRAEKEQRAERGVTIGYASGSPTHGRDFAVAAQPLALLMDRHPSLRLCLTGFVDLDRYTCLMRHRNRIDQRPHVDYSQLFDEYVRFDINLTPLEIGNPFCEAKSPLKYIEAGSVSVPTVASRTRSFGAAIADGETGFLAASPGEWVDRLDSLISNPGLRFEMGKKARSDIEKNYGGKALGALAELQLRQIRAKFHRLSVDGTT